MKEFYELSPAETEELGNYGGARHTLFDGSGNVLNETDTRVPRLHFLQKKKDLKTAQAIKFNKKWPDYKLVSARADALEDKTEQAQILADEVLMNKEYELRKAKMQEAIDAGDIDLMEEYSLDERWVLTDRPNWLTLGLTRRYALVKEEV